MIVVVDANIIVGNPLMADDVWTQLADAVKAKRVQVFAPEIVLQEAVASRRRLNRSIARKLRENAESAPASVRSIVEQAAEECVRLANVYEQELRGAWSDFGFNILESPAVSHAMVAGRAIGRTAPFNEQGGGYRDALHWYSVLELARQRPTERFVFVSNDKAFAGKGNDLKTQLATEFGEHSQASIQLCRLLENLEVPGHYASDPIDDPRFADSIRSRAFEVFCSDYPLHQMHTSGLEAPGADWSSLSGVSDFELTSITSRRVERQHELEVRFKAKAIFRIKETYVVDDAEEMEVAHDFRDMRVEIEGVAESLSGDTVGVISRMRADRVGFDSRQLARWINAMGREGGITPEVQNEIESIFPKLSADSSYD
jgi:hypothetical protein